MYELVGRCTYTIYGINQVPEDGQRSSHTGHTMAIWQDSNLENGRWHSNDMFTTVRYSMMTIYHTVSIATDVWALAQNAKYCATFRAVLGYVWMSEEASINHVGHSNLYDCNDTGYTWNDKIHLVWENNGKGFNESGKKIYCWNIL